MFASPGDEKTLFFFPFIYLAVPGLSFSVWDLVP